MPATLTAHPDPAPVTERRPAPAPRRLERPRGLPSGRAVAGGLLATVAALGTFVAARGVGDGPPQTAVTAARAIDVGERLGPGDLATAPLDLPPEVAAHTFTEPAELEGAVVLAPLRAGALVQASQVATAAPDDPTPDAPSHELSLRLPRERAVDGMLDRGERVDVLATYGTGDDAGTVVVVRDAVVTRIGAEADATLGSDGGITLTLLLPDDEAVLRTTHAKDVAALTLVRSTRDGGEPPGPDRFDGPPAPEASP